MPKKILILIAVLYNLFSFGQAIKPSKTKIYKSTDRGINREAVLILYNDNSFTNYGIYSNETERDWYVWYTTGKYQKQADKILFKSNDTIQNAPKLIKTIKDSYLTLKEHSLICNHYEFVQLKYNDYPLFVEDTLIIDGTKKITYLESYR